MPCNTISQVQVKFGPNTNRDLLDAAALAINLRITSFNATTGAVVISGSASAPAAMEAALRREYSKQVLKSQCARFGWGFKQEADGTFSVQKARF